MRKELKLNPDTGDSSSKKYKRDDIGVWRSLRFAEVWSQAVSFDGGFCQESGFSYNADVFTFNFLYK
jgi:hypothetical protein